MTNRLTIILSTAIPVGVVVVALVVAVGVCLRNRKLRLFNRGITPIADEEIESWKNNERDDEKEPIPESSPPLPLPTSTSAVAPFFATATTETTAAITSPSPPPPSRHDNSRDGNHGSNDDDIGRQVQQVQVREHPSQSSHHRQNNSSVSSVQKPPSAVIYQGSGSGGGGGSSSSSSRSSQHNRHHRHNSSSGDRYPLNRSRSTTGGGPGTAHHPGPGTREGGPSFDPMGSTAPLVLARAPNSRPGLTDETVQGDDAFIPPVKRQSSRLSKVHHQHQHHRQRSAGVTPAAGSSSRKSSVDRKRSMSITSGTQQQHHMYSVSVSGGNNPPRVSVDQDDGGAHIGRAIG